jgi:GNAT superfamily N-acetyltransferase
MDVVKRSIEHSLAFGVFKEDQQVGFARIITDYATFAYLGDVFILEPFRGRGLSKWLMEVIVGHPELQGLRRWMLLTRDAHGLYGKVGFTELINPERYMELHFPDVYKGVTLG